MVTDAGDVKAISIAQKHYKPTTHYDRVNGQTLERHWRVKVSLDSTDGSHWIAFGGCKKMELMAQLA